MRGGTCGFCLEAANLASKVLVQRKWRMKIVLDLDYLDSQDDTIVAVSTPPGEGGIGIVRLSGSRALEIGCSHFRRKQDLSRGSGLKRDFSPAARKLYHGYFTDQQGEAIDEILFSYMPGPHSYTCEDVVEINAHGGILSIRNILNALMHSEARLAAPGEFTRRAYLNGRIDLVQAESNLALIRAKTEKGMKAALQGVQGKLSASIYDLRRTLLDISAEIEVNVDFPHEDVEWELQHRGEIISQVQVCKEQVDRLRERHRAGKILQEGLKTVIAGKPNVGKSSLYNYLLGENRALVTDIPGTTRDLLSDFINIQGIPLKIMDTAGIRVDGDVVERLGMDISRHALEEADLIIFILDAGTGITEEDHYVYRTMDEMGEASLIILVNKIDLTTGMTPEVIGQVFQYDGLVYASILENIGMDELKRAIIEKTYAGEIQGEEGALVLEARQGELLQRAAALLQDALVSLEGNMPMDIITIDLNQAYERLGEIVGEHMKGDLLEVIFGRFCIGK